MSKLKENIRTKLINISKKHIGFRAMLRKLLGVYRKLRFKIETLGIKVDDKTMIFSCYNGQSYTCSPKAIYEYMLTDEKFKDYKFIWAFKDVEK